MSQEERLEDQESQDELYDAFEALGGKLTWDEFNRQVHITLVGPTSLLLGGDTAEADEVLHDSIAGLQEIYSELVDSLQARAWLCRAIVNRARSLRRNRNEPPAACDEAACCPDGQSEYSAVRALPERQLEAVVLRRYIGLFDQQVAAAMGVSIGAMRSHLTRGMSSLQDEKTSLPNASTDLRPPRAISRHQPEPSSVA